MPLNFYRINILVNLAGIYSSQMIWTKEWNYKGGKEGH